MRGRLGWGTALAAVIVMCAGVGTAPAATFEVTRTSDPAPGNCTPADCSLREAVLAANDAAGADVVLLPNRRSPYRLTQAGTSEDAALDGDLDVTGSPLRIAHPGKGRATIDAEGLAERHLEAFAPLRLSKLVLTGGSDSDGGSLSASANVEISKSVLHGNESTNVGGAIDMEDDATLLIADSVLRDNVSQNTAGAIRDGSGKVTIVRSRLMGNEAASDGGAIRLSSSPATIVHSTFARNTSGADGGAIQSDLEGPLAIRKTTFDRNSAVANGGGLYAVGAERLRITASTLSRNGTDANGGGLYVDGPPVKIENSTFAGNRADTRGGGIHAQDGADVSLNAVTVARNRAAADDEGLVLIGGGGLSRISSAGFSVRNTLIALNTIGASGSRSRNDCVSDVPFDSLGNNLLSETPSGVECDGFDGPNDLVRAIPRIGKLKRNGGPTETVALKRGSAAIGAAHKPSSPKRDQRGTRRDKRPDIGAYER